LRKGRAKRFKFYLPILIFVGTILCIELVPFSRLWLAVNFRLYKAEREKIASEIFVGQLAPNVSYNQSLIRLPPGDSQLSAGGGEAVILHFEKGSGVYYFTFRGILGSSSGYLYMDSNSIPKADDFVSVSKIADRWYFVQTR
jgi:hypothetical protein